jgi:hypothetical protein
MGQGVAELLVLGAELADAFVGQREASVQWL